MVEFWATWTWVPLIKRSREVPQIVEQKRVQHRHVEQFVAGHKSIDVEGCYTFESPSELFFKKHSHFGISFFNPKMGCFFHPGATRAQFQVDVPVAEQAAPQEQVVEIPVPMQEEEIVHVPKIITQTRQVQQCLGPLKRELVEKCVLLDLVQNLPVVWEVGPCFWFLSSTVLRSVCQETLI